MVVLPAQAEDVSEPVVAVVTTPGGDDSSYEIPLTTTITFDGVTYSSVYATTNSVITFGTPDGAYWDYPMTPSISLYSMDWVVYPDWRSDEHLIIRASDGGFQVDISARPIWLQNAEEPTNINIVAAINTDGTVSISYSLTGPTYEGQTRTGVRLTNGDVVTLEEYGIVKVEEPPVLEPIPVDPTPSPDTTPSPEPTISPEPNPVIPPAIPEGATLLSEGNSIEVIAPAGQRILSIVAWYGDPDNGARGIEVSSTLTEMASGKTSVTIESSNIYSDPAPGTVKTLIFVVNYEQIPQPEPSEEPQPEPTIEPTPQPEPSPSQTPVPEPSQPSEPEVTPVPEPQPSLKPSPLPIQPAQPETQPIKPIPTPEPTPSTNPVPSVSDEITKETIIESIESIDPDKLSEEDVAKLIEVANEIFETAEPGSQEYQQALEALAIAAEADDVQLSEELASIPLLGDVANAAVEVFNNLGNIGADMSPETREEAEKTIIASVIAAQAAIGAVQATTAVAATSASNGASRKVS